MCLVWKLQNLALKIDISKIGYKIRLVTRSKSHMHSICRFVTNFPLNRGCFHPAPPPRIGACQLTLFCITKKVSIDLQKMLQLDKLKDYYVMLYFVNNFCLGFRQFRCSLLYHNHILLMSSSHFKEITHPLNIKNIKKGFF